MERTRWTGIALLGMITIVSALVRLNDVSNGVARFPDDVRYLQNPLTTWLHVIPGMIFLIVGPLQFSRTMRTRWIRLHRILGRVFIVTGLFLVAVSFGIVFMFPAIGGAVTAVANFTFGLLMAFSLIKALVHIRRREISLHREWMIRALAIGLAASTIRLAIVAFVVIANAQIEQIFGISFWIGFILNALIAEVWIRRTRVHRRAHAKQGVN
jgi:uncharacterized membrane protein